MSWFAKVSGAYAKESVEAKSNAVEIYYILTDFGFEYTPICGILGNIGWEGGYNPWRWGGDEVLSIMDYGKITGQVEYGMHGYGLYQFTPASDYMYTPAVNSLPMFDPNFSDRAGRSTDGIAQTQVVGQNILNGWIASTSYPISFQEYKTYGGTPQECAAAWFFNYERGISHLNERKNEAQYWYDILSDLIPPEPKIWLYYIKRRDMKYYGY